MYSTTILILLFGLFCIIYSEDSSVNDQIEDIWGGGDDEGDQTITTTIASPRFDNGTDFFQPEECECVPYYLCDRPRDKKENYGTGRINIRMNVECPHYLLKCCDDEDPTEPYFPETQIEAKGCGYSNPNSRTNPTDGLAEFGEFPWVVAILSSSKHQLSYVCTGSLIHPEVVLTAAHCIKNIIGKPIVRAGEWDSQNDNEMYPHQEREVASVTIHAKYDPDPISLINDIAILFLKKPFVLASHIGVVCLPPPDTVFDKSQCLSNGWRKETFGKEGVMTKIELPMVPRTQCEQDLRRTRLGSIFKLHQSFVCAGGEAGKDTCHGDGGSPLACPVEGETERYYQAGIVSWGVGCGGYKIPGVYVNVAFFRNWIDEKLKKKNIDIGVYQV